MQPARWLVHPNNETAKQWHLNGEFEERVRTVERGRGAKGGGTKWVNFKEPGL